MHEVTVAIAAANVEHENSPAVESKAVSLTSLHWHDLPLELQERAYESFYPRERRLFRRLNKACRQQACHQFIRHISVLALHADPGTLTQRFSNLHTLVLAAGIQTNDLTALGSSCFLAHLKCGVNDAFTEVFASTLATQFPNLQLLDLTCLRYVSNTALQGLSTLTGLTALAIKPDPRDLPGELPLKLLENLPAQLSSLQSLDISHLAAPDSRASSAVLAHLMQLTRLGLSSRRLGDNNWDAFLAPLRQLTGLQHLEMPWVDRQPVAWLHLLSSLTRFDIPGVALNLPVNNNGRLFPQLQSLVCRNLGPAAVQGQVLPSCTRLELSNLCTAQQVASALQRCPGVQHLTLSVSMYAAEDLEDLVNLGQVVAAVPSVQVTLICVPTADQLMFAVQTFDQLKLWPNLRAVGVASIDNVHWCTQPLIEAFGHIRYLRVGGFEVKQTDVLAVCIGLPLLREYVLCDMDYTNQPFSGNPAECAQLLVSGPLAARQLRISICYMLDAQVSALNRELQDAGCNGVWLDNSYELKFW